MKRGKPLRRRVRLRADPDTTRDWQRRSRKPLPAKRRSNAPSTPNGRPCAPLW